MIPMIVPVILSGGSGSRLWPISRDLHPKPFIRLADGQSLLQKAFLRGAQLPGVTEIVTVTNRELFFKTEDDFREVNFKGMPTSYILEPFGRNTAPAIATAAIQIEKTHGKEAIMLVLAADHLISDAQAFQNAVMDAVQFASEGKLVTFGIEPTFPETGYGYIEFIGNTVLRFVEKPSIETAKEYCSTGRFLWNSGMLCFTAGTLINQMKLFCPNLFDVAQECVNKSQIAIGQGFSQIKLDAEAFSRIPSDSIDYAVMEKSDNISVIPCDIGWSDIGSWTALGNLTASDAFGNRTQGEVLLHNTHDCIIQSYDHLIAAVGINNLIIIDTADAILVADKSCTQDVKHIYSKLKESDHDAHKLHRTIYRPWGNYSVLSESKHFKIKRIEVNPGGSLSLQMHFHRSEHWIVVSGTAKVVNGENSRIVNINESTYIPAGHKHRLENPGLLNLVLIEVQSGEYVGEDDIVRFEDSYGRCQLL
jgi:mannose-1-phosphate guanylyltransferase/mannose-6-phosphate isomerase